MDVQEDKDDGFDSVCDVVCNIYKSEFCTKVFQIILNPIKRKANLSKVE